MQDRGTGTGCGHKREDRYIVAVREGGAPVPGVVVAHPAPALPGRPHHHVRAVHRVEVPPAGGGQVQHGVVRYSMEGGLLGGWQGGGEGVAGRGGGGGAPSQAHPTGMVGFGWYGRIPGGGSGQYKLHLPLLLQPPPQQLHPLPQHRFLVGSSFKPSTGRLIGVSFGISPLQGW